MVWNKVPYTNFHELNQDWIIRIFTEFQQQMDNIVALSTIKYADPFQWNITNQYEKNTLVIDPNTGTAYMSLQPVPAGIGLDNTDYWTPVLDLNRFISGLRESITSNIESNTTVATAAYPASSLIWVDQTLYRAISNITAGDTFTIGSNIEVITVEDIIEELTQFINEKATEINNFETQINQSFTDYQTQVNTTLDNFNTGFENYQTEVNTTLDNFNTSFESYKAEVNQDMEDFQNEMKDELTGKLGGIIDTTKGCLFIGDSWTNDPNLQANLEYPALVASITGMTEVNYGVAGAGFLRPAGGSGETFIQALERSALTHGVEDIGCIVFMGGYNDVNYLYEPYDIYLAAQAFMTRLGELYPGVPVIWMGMNLRCFGITRSFRQAMDYITNAPLVIDSFRNVVRFNNRWQWGLTGKDQYFKSNDPTHPNYTGHRLLAKEVTSAMYGASPEYVLESPRLLLTNGTYLNETLNGSIIQNGEYGTLTIEGYFSAKGTNWSNVIEIGTVPQLYLPEADVVSGPCYASGENGTPVNIAILKSTGKIYLQTIKSGQNISSGFKVYPGTIHYLLGFPQP